MLLVPRSQQCHCKCARTPARTNTAAARRPSLPPSDIQQARLSFITHSTVCGQSSCSSHATNRDIQYGGGGGCWSPYLDALHRHLDVAFIQPVLHRVLPMVSSPDAPNPRNRHRRNHTAPSSTPSLLPHACGPRLRVRPVCSAPTSHTMATVKATAKGKG